MDKTDGNIKFLQLYLVAADGLIEIGRALASAVWSVDEYLSAAIQFSVIVSSKISAAVGLVSLHHCRAYHL
jgi:hypothetical protein